MNKRIDPSDVPAAANKADAVPSRPVLEVDVAKYQAYLDDAGLSDEQKQELIEALWSIIVGFVDLGFGVHPVQEVCGEVEKSINKSGDQYRDEIYLDNILDSQFEDAAGGREPGAVKE